jgi:hypothetical protein
MDAAATKLRSEQEEDRRERDDARQELNAMRAALHGTPVHAGTGATGAEVSYSAAQVRGSSARESRAISRGVWLEAELHEARAAATAAIELAADHKAVVVKLRAARRRTQEQAQAVKSDSDVERAGRAAAERALEEVRGECAWAWERVLTAEEEVSRKSRRVRDAEAAAAGAEQELETALGRCTRAEALVRDLRREGQALVAETAAVSRRCEAQDVAAQSLARRNDSLEAELRVLRQYVGAQREDIAAALMLTRVAKRGVAHEQRVEGKRWEADSLSPPHG